MTLDVHHPSLADVDPLGKGLSVHRCRQRASEHDKGQQFHDDVFRWRHARPLLCNCNGRPYQFVGILAHAAFFDVELLQKHLSQRRSQVIGSQLSFSTGAVRKSNVNDHGGNSVTAANFVTFVIYAADVDFSGSSHFGLRDGKLFDSRATKSSWTE